MSGELTSAQRRFLRSAGRTLQPKVTIGKAGINENVLAHIRGQLMRLELLKVRLPALSKVEGPASDAANRADDAKQIADGAGAMLVDLVGRNAVLYRPNDQLPEEARIRLTGQAERSWRGTDRR